MYSIVRQIPVLAFDVMDDDCAATMTPMLDHSEIEVDDFVGTAPEQTADK